MKRWRIFLCLLLVCCFITACAAKPSAAERTPPAAVRTPAATPASTPTASPEETMEYVRENPVHVFLEDYRQACDPFFQAADTVHTDSPEAYEHMLALPQHAIRLQRLLGAAEHLAYIGEGGYSGSFFGLHAGQGDVWKTPDGYSIRCVLEDGSRMEGELSLNRLTCIWSGEEAVLGMCTITFEGNGWSAAVYIDESWDLLRADANQFSYIKQQDTTPYDLRQAAVKLSEYPLKDWAIPHLQVTADEARMVQPE